jgi:phospholipid transport system substrate-binding protein
LTLGKHWRSASSEQRDRFTQEFRALLVRSYSSVLAGYANQQVEFLPSAEPADAKRATVNTRIVEAGRPPIAVDYRLRQVDDAWKIYDVSIEGVSLAINYRSTFADEISAKGLDGLIAGLRSSNAAGCVAKSASVAMQC